MGRYVALGLGNVGLAIARTREDSGSLVVAGADAALARLCAQRR